MCFLFWLICVFVTHLLWVKAACSRDQRDVGLADPARRGAVEVAAFSPGVGAWEHIKTEPFGNMVEIWICSFQLANWDQTQRNTNLGVKAPLDYLCYLATGPLTLGGWVTICLTGPRGDNSLKPVLKTDYRHEQSKQLHCPVTLSFIELRHLSCFFRFLFSRNIFFFRNTRVKEPLLWNSPNMIKVCLILSQWYFSFILKTHVHGTVKSYA